MCTYNTITSHTYHFEIQKRDSEESLLTFVNLFPNFFCPDPESDFPPKSTNKNILALPC